MKRFEKFWAKDKSGRHSGANQIMDMIKHNPIPVALIGIGLGWMIFSGRSGGARQDHRGPDRHARRQGALGAVDHRRAPAPGSRSASTARCDDRAAVGGRRVLESDDRVVLAALVRGHPVGSVARGVESPLRCDPAHAGDRRYGCSATWDGGDRCAVGLDVARSSGSA